MGCKVWLDVLDRISQVNPKNVTAYKIKLSDWDFSVITPTGFNQKYEPCKSEHENWVNPVHHILRKTDKTGVCVY